MNYRFLTAYASCFALTACMVPESPSGADILSSGARSQIPAGWSGSHSKGDVVPNWVRTFGDPALTRLVADAVARNPDLAAAAAKVEASRAAVRVAAGELYPRAGVKVLGERQGNELSGDLGLGIDPPTLGGTGVDNTGGSTSSRSVESSSQRSVYGLGIGAAWEADVWGRVRSKKKAAIADSQALEADYQFARQSLAAAVVRAYFSTAEASQQAANAEETLGIYQEYLKLADKLKEQGFASDYDIAQIKARAAEVKDTMIVAQAARAQAIRAIEVITSRYPAGKLKTRRDFPSQPGAVPSGLPAQLLERRPDIVAAERRFAASFYRVNEARTARLPRFALSSSAGVGSSRLDSVGTLDAFTWSLAGGITQPIFFGGELKAAEEIRSAEQKAAAASYTATALRAFEDVENALASEYYLRQRETALKEVVDTSGSVVKLGRIQLEEGQSEMFTILRLTGENLAAKIELTKVRASRLRERANLHLALGGDFKGTGMPSK